MKRYNYTIEAMNNKLITGLLKRSTVMNTQVYSYRQFTCKRNRPAMKHDSCLLPAASWLSVNTAKAGRVKLVSVTTDYLCFCWLVAVLTLHRSLLGHARLDWNYIVNYRWNWTPPTNADSATSTFVRFGLVTVWVRKVRHCIGNGNTSTRYRTTRRDTLLPDAVLQKRVWLSFT